MKNFTRKFLFYISLFAPALYFTDSKASSLSSIDSPTLLYSNADTAHSYKMAKRGTEVMYLINAAAIGTVALKQDKVGALQYVETMLSSALIQVVGKEVTHRQRPNGSDHKSLPSGHASSSFAPAAFLYYRYGAEYGVPAFIAATFVSYTRVEARKHYVTDVLAGAAVGILSAKYFTTKFGENVVQIVPTVGVHEVGLSVAAQF